MSWREKDEKNNSKDESVVRCGNDRAYGRGVGRCDIYFYFYFNLYFYVKYRD